MLFDYEEIYDLEYRSTEDLDLYQRLIVEKNAGGSVLEIGCGTGRFYNRFKHQLNGDYTGIDLDAAALRKFEEKFPGVTIYESNFEDYCPIEPFDLVAFPFNGLSYISHKEINAFLAKVRCATSPNGGVFGFDVFNYDPEFLKRNANYKKTLDLNGLVFEKKSQVIIRELGADMATYKKIFEYRSEQIFIKKEFDVFARSRRVIEELLTQNSFNFERCRSKENADLEYYVCYAA